MSLEFYELWVLENLKKKKPHTQASMRKLFQEGREKKQNSVRCEVHACDTASEQSG